MKIMDCIKKICLLLLAGTVSAEAYSAVTFSGTDLPVITEEPQASTGLDEVSVLYSTHGVSAQYEATSDNPVKWYRFSSMGGGYAEEVPFTQSGRISSIELQGSMGYIIEEGTSRHYFWVIDYSNFGIHIISNIDILPESDCANTILNTNIWPKITYYSINGAPQTLSRDLELSYNTLVWDAGISSFRQNEVITKYPFISGDIHTQAPLCNTTFTLSGDRFLRQWGKEVSMESVEYITPAVSANTSAVQTIRESDNEKKDGSGTTLGGSAPCEIEFMATPTDAAIYHEWQFASDPEFTNLTDRYNDLDVTYTFRNQGTTYVRFMASNAAGSCDWFSESYQVNIGESALECPNAFSPGSTEGINDEWKVSYKSIISFECHIFNRWGQTMAKFTDPSQGWDGRYHGKLVPPGVYFYVIKATGADGKEYKLNGDINIINFNDTRRTSSPVQE